MGGGPEQYGIGMPHRHEDLASCIANLLEKDETDSDSPIQTRSILLIW